MPGDERLELTRQWLRYAQDDLDGAEYVTANIPSLAPRHACFFAQQAAEKALKAVLIYLHIDYPRHHNLDELRDIIGSPRLLVNEPHTMCRRRRGTPASVGIVSNP